jgi:HEAT repeat protein
MSRLVLFIRSSVYILILFALLILFYIVLRRVYQQVKDKRFNLRYVQIEEELLNALSTPGPESAVRLAEEYKKYPNVLTKLLLDYAKVLSGPEKERLKIIYRIALEKKSLKDLRSRRTIRRLRATRLLGFFIDPLKMDFMLKLLEDKPIVRLAAVQAISQLSTPETLPLVFKAFEADLCPNIHSYISIILSLGGKAEVNIREALKKPISSEKIALLIELVGAIPLRSLYPDILPFAGHPEKEIRIKVARALGGLLNPDSAPALIRLAYDEAWEVQAQAVKSLGKLKSLEALDVLSQAFFSKNWYVRFNARSGLMSLGEAGVKRLEEISRQTRDSYAAAMAAMALHDLYLSCEQMNT